MAELFIKQAGEINFCTSVNCLDGRVQLPVIRYLQNRFHVEYVDTITEPGPNLILAKQLDENTVQSILRKISFSVEKHSSVGIALTGHHGCAGNPSNPEEQKQHLLAGIEFLRQRFLNIPIIALWVDENRNVHELEGSDS